MALTERTEIGQMTVLADGQILVRKDTVIEKDGKEITRTYHRHIVDPLDQVTNEDQCVKNIAAVVHTPSVKAARQAFKDAQE
tara:strand:- start:3973 stop:4218 length:246 start_codon:yes stop_codon:yes gene_type:complete